MKPIALMLILTLLGCSRSAQPRPGDQFLKWVPWGTSLQSARQIMEQHGFTCSVATYSGPEQMTNTAEADAVLWKTVEITNGITYHVTNVSHLKCVKTNCTVVFALANGRTARLSASGSIR